MTQTRNNRFDSRTSPFGLAGRELDALFGRLVNGNEPVVRSHPVDVREGADGFVVEADLPGFTKAQIEITLENNILTLVADRTLGTETPVTAETPTAETPTEAAQVRVEDPTFGYHLRERRPARFERNFKLPPTIDESSIKASLENGVLTLQIAKRPETKPRKITVG